MKSTLPALLLFLFLSSVGHAENAYYRFPAVHGDSLVFTAEGDLWRVALQGGSAQRLTTHAGLEAESSISADGRSVAFVAGYDASPEVYLMPLAGGAPKRLSFGAGNPRVAGWTPQGEVLYASSAVVGPGSSFVLRAINPDTLAERTLPFADANQASFDATEGHVYFTRFGLQITGDHARGYHGGAMAQIWRAAADGKTEATRLAADIDASLRSPMWWNGRLYHLSDEGGSDNLWSMAGDGSARQAVTRHRDFDVMNPRLQDGRIVYQYGADIRVLNLESGEDRVVPIDLVSDFEQRRTRWLDKPLDYLDGISIDSKGERAILVARGAVSLAATDERRRIDIAVPANARARSAVASSDGKSIYAISDIGGNEEIWRFAADGSGPGKALTRDSTVRRWRLYPSPDGKSIAFDDKAARLTVLDIESGNMRVLDQGQFGGDDTYASVLWSADSSVIAFARPDSNETRNQLFLATRDGSTKSVLSSDRYDSFAPSFSPDGKWLYFLSNRAFVANPSAPWGDRNMGPGFDKRTRIYALALQSGNRFPFQPADELSSGKEEAKPSADAADGKDKSAKDSAAAEKKSKTARLPAIEWKDLAARLYEVPIDSGNYRALASDDKRLYFLDQDAGEEAQRLMSLGIGNDGDKPASFTAGVGQFELSADRKRILLQKWSERGNGDVFIVDAGAKAPESLDKHKVRVSDWRLAIEPRAEWQQMFLDAWRMHREFSFDPKMRELDWDAVRQRYEPLLPRVADRWELDDLLGQMTAELGILHSQVRGGEMRKDAETAKTAGLGAELVAQADGLRIAHIYRSDPELPGERAPLAMPGVDAREGDVITAINGRAVKTAADLAQVLANQAGRQVLLQIQRGTQALRRVVVAIDERREANLRYGDWEQSRRERVLAAAKGRIGYLHLRAMGGDDIAEFAREFYTNISREGLIIDVRRNNGGNIDSWIIEKLLRRRWAFWTFPHSQPQFNMQQTFAGHLVVLIDERTYSDGETFAAGIKALNLAPLIGQRTAGAGIWLSGRNPLIDGGIARIAEFGQFSVDNGRWLIEGRGVSPDIAVVNLPHDTFNGGDAQLDAALNWLEDKLKQQPIKPAVPNAISPVGTPGWDMQ